MRAGFEDIGPDEVEKVDEGVFAAEALDSQSEVLDGCSCCLPVNQIAISQCVLEKRSDCIDVILGHLSDVLEHECQTFQDSVLYIQLLHSVL